MNFDHERSDQLKDDRADLVRLIRWAKIIFAPNLDPLSDLTNRWLDKLEAANDETQAELVQLIDRRLEELFK